MKKYVVALTAFLFLVLPGVKSQGVSKLWGLIGGSPQSNHSTNGMIFSTDSSGNNFQLQYNFPVTISGGLPGNLEMAVYNNKFYGTTTQGGSYNYGTIFEYDPVTGVYTKKIDFGSNLNATGGTPRGSLLLYNGKFYGMNSEYGVSSGGCLFEWDPATNVFTKKFDFTGSGGAYMGSYPHNSLRLYNGKMYGTTQQGGTNNLGVIFEWDPATNVYKDIYDGSSGQGSIFYNNVTPFNNKLYCASHAGGTNNYGVLFSLDPALPNGSNYTQLNVFNHTNGAQPNNNEMMVYNNKLYGCTNDGGINFGGVLFELNPATSVYTKLLDFEYTSTGRNPLGRLVANGSKFLGLCSVGGVNGTGSVFEWDPANPNTVVKKAEFGTNNFNNPINPGSTFVLFNSKFYATSYNGGFVNRGTMFEYDYSTNTLTKKINFDAAENGRIPYGKPLLYNGKLYGTSYTGPQEIFGTPYGCLWSFDPSTSTYSRKVTFDNTNNANNGRTPLASPVVYNGKLYGLTSNGGAGDWGVLYEYDPVTEVYTKKDIQSMGAGAYPDGELTLFNNKLYGMLGNGGAGNNGVIFSYDPATGILAKLYDINNLGSYSPTSHFTVYNNKLYGTTTSGGANNNGAVFSYDPATNTAISLADLSAPVGVTVRNAMVVYNNKMYNTALGGGTGRGTIFSFDPATNTLTNIYNFTTNAGGTGYDPQGGLTIRGNRMYCLTSEGGTIVNVVELDPATNTVTVKSSYTTTNGNLPVAHNGLTVVPAFIANGIPGGCETYPVVNINASNNTRWVPILNNAGDVVAEIKANGFNLGNVTPSVYINNGTVREDAMKQLYMDRNITLNVQNQPAGNVDIRLYIKTSEYLALKNAVNSIGQPSGITSINDITILKNADNCPAVMITSPGKPTTTGSAYEYGYVVSASINSFSTFFFAKNNFAILPLSLLSFDAKKDNDKVLVSWKTENEISLQRYEVERSTDGISFTRLADQMPRGGTTNVYTVTDDYPVPGINYYRLKSIDKDGRYTYSKIARVDFNKNNTISISPNPASDEMVIRSGGKISGIILFDINGRIVKQFSPVAGDRYNISGIRPGIYVVKVFSERETNTARLVIQ